MLLETAPTQPSPSNTSTSDPTSAAPAASHDASPGPKAPETPPVVDPRVAPIGELLAAHATGTVLLHPDGRVVYFGAGAATLLAVDAQASVQKGIFELLPPASIAHVATALHQARSGITEPAFAIDVPGSAQRPTIRLAVQLAPIVENGSVLAVTVSLTELASRHAVNAALQGDLVTAVETAASSPLIAFVLDGRGQCTSMASGWAHTSGRPIEAAIGTGWLQAMAEPDRQRFRAQAGAAHQARHGWRSAVVVARPDGSQVRAEIAAAPIVGADGQITAYFGLVAVAPDTSTASVVQPTASVAPSPTSTAPSPAPTHGSVAQTVSGAHVASEAALRPDPSNSAPQAAGLPVADPFAVRADIVLQEPLRPAPKLAMPERQAADWNPVVKEGYTDPALLMERIKSDETAESDGPTEQPGVDKTTGLANKLLFAQHVASTVGRMSADALTVSVSFIELHGLDVQRAAVGSRVANDYLFLLAKRLEATIRSIEIAGRIDGNILGVLSINWLFADDLPIVARRLMHKLGEPLAGREGAEISVAMNLGLAVASQGEDVNQLFRRAWESLQRAKALGSNEFDLDLGG